MILKFGELEKVVVDDDFIWYVQTEIKSENFGEVAFCLVCDRAEADDETILLAEQLLVISINT